MLWHCAQPCWASTLTPHCAFHLRMLAYHPHVRTCTRCGAQVLVIGRGPAGDGPRTSIGDRKRARPRGPARANGHALRCRRGGFIGCVLRGGM